MRPAVLRPLRHRWIAPAAVAVVVGAGAVVGGGLAVAGLFMVGRAKRKWAAR